MKRRIVILGIVILAAGLLCLGNHTDVHTKHTEYEYKSVQNTVEEVEPLLDEGWEQVSTYHNSTNRRWYARMRRVTWSGFVYSHTIYPYLKEGAFLALIGFVTVVIGVSIPSTKNIS